MLEMTLTHLNLQAVWEQETRSVFLREQGRPGCSKGVVVRNCDS
jgi:hypothetical protein